jgi:hypothetical protein
MRAPESYDFARPLSFVARNRAQAFKVLQPARPDSMQTWTTLRRSNCLLILVGMSRWQRRMGSS